MQNHFFNKAVKKCNELKTDNKNFKMHVVNQKHALQVKRDIKRDDASCDNVMRFYLRTEACKSYSGINTIDFILTLFMTHLIRHHIVIFIRSCCSLDYVKRHSHISETS